MANSRIPKQFSPSGFKFRNFGARAHPGASKMLCAVAAATAMRKEGVRSSGVCLHTCTLPLRCRNPATESGTSKLNKHYAQTKSGRNLMQQKKPPTEHSMPLKLALGMP